MSIKQTARWWTAPVEIVYIPYLTCHLSTMGNTLVWINPPVPQVKYLMETDKKWLSSMKAVSSNLNSTFKQ